MVMNSKMLMNLKNPMSISTLIIVKTLMVCMLMNLLSFESWFSMMFFLMMMVAGLLIILSYMTSTVSNETFKFSINLTMIMIIHIENNMI